MISRSRLALLALLLAAPLAAGCAYSLGPTNARVAGAQSISIDPFPNQTTEPQLTDLVVTAVRREVQRDGTFHLGTRGGADILVTGTIISYGRLPVGSKRNDVLTPTDYDVKITAHVKATQGGQTVYEGDVSGTAQVVFNSDLNNAERENNPVAVENLARNLISAIANGSW